MVADARSRLLIQGRVQVRRFVVRPLRRAHPRVRNEMRQNIQETNALPRDPERFVHISQTLVSVDEVLDWQPECQRSQLRGTSRVPDGRDSDLSVDETHQTTTRLNVAMFASVMNGKGTLAHGWSVGPKVKHGRFIFCVSLGWPVPPPPAYTKDVSYGDSGQLRRVLP